MSDLKSPSEYFQASAKPSSTGSSHLVSVRLEDKLIQKLARVGNDRNLTMSDTIRMVLEQGLERIKWNH